MRVGRKVVGGGGADIGEVAAPAARNADLFARRLGVVDHQHGAAALAGLDRRHHAGSPGAQNDDVE